MKSYELVEYGQPLKPRVHENPKPQGKEVLIRMNASGVCHSDIHIWHGDLPMPMPLVMGHEIAGTVVDVGGDVTCVVKGSRYVVFSWIGCGDCLVCRAGNENLCEAPQWMGVNSAGGYADHVLVKDEKYLVDIHDLDPALAAPFACSGLTAFSALAKIGPEIYKNSPVVIIGGGGLGLMCLEILKALHGLDPIVVDISPEKRQLALEMGAKAAIDGRAADVVDQIKAAAGQSVYGMVDFVGSPDTMNLSFGVLAKSGRFVTVGLFGGNVTFPVINLPFRAISLAGSLVGNLAELHALMDLVLEGKISYIPIHRKPLESVTESLRELQDGRILGRIVLCEE